MTAGKELNPAAQPKFRGSVLGDGKPVLSLLAEDFQ